jgi:hypothetical protein
MSGQVSGPSLAARLEPLGRRVRLRWLLERVRVGAVLALAGGAALALLGRFLGYPGWPDAALLWAAVSMLAALGLGLRRWPDVWTIARAADGLGLAERVSSALHADRVGHPAAPLLAADARRALSRARVDRYSIVPAPRRWLQVPALAVLMAAATLAPLPAWGDGWGAEEARAVAEARKSVEELKAKLEKPAVPEPLTVATEAELQALEERLREARSAAEAVRALERAQEQLASLLGSEDYAWRRAMERLASAWGDNPILSEVAAALRAEDPETVQGAMDRLASEMAGMSGEDLQRLQLALQSGANSARDLPALSGSLREAAAEAGAAAGGRGGETGAMEQLSSLLSQGAARSAGLRAAQGAMASLGRAQASLATGSGSGATAMASGRPSGGASGGQQGASGGGSPGSGSGSGAGDGSGSDSGSGPGGGSGSGSGSGSGTGSGSGSGSGAGSGAGSGSGAGAGAGGGPSPGQPGSGSAGATTSAGRAAPSTAGATRYDPIYAPSLMGGEGGPGVHAPGDAEGSGGATVELPESPLALGAVRPYDEVYGQYEAAARQSLSRRPLPPSLQGLVQRYFSSLAPAQSGSQP